MDNTSLSPQFLLASSQQPYDVEAKEEAQTSSFTSFSDETYRRFKSLLTSIYAGITLDARCQLLPSTDCRRGTVRYIGPVPEIPSGSSGTGGIWVGIELDEPTGKNDGSITNTKQDSDDGTDKEASRSSRYFQCRPKCGVFVRPERLEIGDFAMLDELGENMEEM